MNHPTLRTPSPTIDPRPAARRRWLGGTVALFALGLGACGLLPAGRFTAGQIKVLRELGFTESDEGWTLNLSGKVLFAFAEDRLGPSELETIAHLARTLQGAGLSRLRIEGHTDNVGEASVNQRLSLRRAEVVAREFEARGIPGSGIQTRGLGMTRPVADNGTETGRAQNRRVSLIVLSD
jgi:outer membrane protein OmpA-like peptidoglycan-associated protein